MSAAQVSKEVSNLFLSYSVSRIKRAQPPTVLFWNRKLGDNANWISLPLLMKVMISCRITVCWNETKNENLILSIDADGETSIESAAGSRWYKQLELDANLINTHMTLVTQLTTKCIRLTTLFSASSSVWTSANWKLWQKHKTRKWN